jgi:hypothetical protein
MALGVASVSLGTMVEVVLTSGTVWRSASGCSDSFAAALVQAAAQCLLQLRSVLGLGQLKEAVTRELEANPDRVGGVFGTDLGHERLSHRN